MDRLTSMAVFVSVMDGGSFTAAAGTHSISATMVAKHVNALEARLNTRLLHRTTRRLSPTEAGRRFAESCRRLLADVAAAETVGAEVSQTPVGRLRIAAPVALGTERVAPLLANYLDRFPDMQADLVLGDRKVDLMDEGFDLAFRVGTLEDDWLVAYPLAPYRMMLAAAPAYLARYGRPHTLAALTEHRLIGFAQFGAEDSWTLVGPDGEHVVPLPPSRLRINYAAALRQAAVAGYGIVLQSCVTLNADLAAGHLVPVLANYAPPPRPLTLARLPDRYMTAGLRAFVDMAVSALGSD